MIKRSQVNQTIDDAIDFFGKNNVSLPPFAHWSETEFKKYSGHTEAIIEGKLGWDVTDFGQENFSEYGRTIFTLRNGYMSKTGLTKPYAQKLMFLRDNQKSTIHYHKSKIEDIVNVAGGKIVIKLWHKTKTDKLSDEAVMAAVDGLSKIYQPGEEIILAPGESINIPSGTYHQFWAQEKSGHVVSMEVSSVNDDKNDNFWLNSGARYPKIEEDEARKYILCYEYDSLKAPTS